MQITADPWTDQSRILLYLPKEKVVDISFDVLKPAVAANDSDSFLLVYWEYFVTLALKKASLQLTFDPTAAEVTVASSFDLFGAAGAGITIACINYELLGAKIGNSVDLTIAIVVQLIGKQLVWYTELRS